MRELLASRVNRGVVHRRRQQPRTRTRVGKGRAGPICRSGLVDPLSLVPPSNPPPPAGRNPDSTLGLYRPMTQPSRIYSAGAQWPVCRSRCQCHPPASLPRSFPTVLVPRSGEELATSIPDLVPGKSPRYPPDTARPRRLHQFGRRGDRREISSPLMNAVADKRVVTRKSRVGDPRVPPRSLGIACSIQPRLQRPKSGVTRRLRGNSGLRL